MQLDQHNLSPVLSYSCLSIEVFFLSSKKETTLHTQETKKPTFEKAGFFVKTR